ncbi:MAG: STAS domain-containing protein [Nocardioidaceae bacterium]|nr:STAS domain-containing protein [Nocardioidaceae bacterium]NUS50073.1 STAS domain-containing protein [Nocardioidaceae bacterium]
MSGSDDNGSADDPGDLEVHATTIDTTLRIVVRGEADRSNSADLGRTLEAIDLSAVTRTRISLGGLTFCDLAGFEVLADYLDGLKERGLRPLVDSASDGVRLVAHVDGRPALLDGRPPWTW